MAEIQLSGTSFASESGGTITVNNATLGSAVNFGSIANDSISGDKIHGGTISNATLDSTVTFPAGMVLQVVNLPNTTYQYVTPTSTFSGPTQFQTTITPISSTSNILLIASFPTYVVTTSAYYDFYKNSADVTETYNLSGQTYGLGDRSGGSVWRSQTIQFLDTRSENTVSEITYGITGYRSATYTSYIGTANEYGVQLTLFEIQG